MGIAEWCKETQATQDALMCVPAGGAHPLVVAVEELGPLLLLLPRLPVLVLCHLLALLLVPPLLVEPAKLSHRLVCLSCLSIVPLCSMAWVLQEDEHVDMRPLQLAQHTCWAGIAACPACAALACCPPGGSYPPARTGTPLIPLHVLDARQVCNRS